MSVEDAVLEKLRVLPTMRKHEVLDFAEFLEQKESVKRSRRSLKGALAHLNIKVTDEDIRQERNEMWRGYTKDPENEK